MTQVILDTQTLLWVFFAPETLPAEIAEMIADSNSRVLFSAASIWELAIKRSLGRPDFLFDPTATAEKALITGFEELPIQSSAAARVADLPFLHRDPFDRLLVAQAIATPAYLLTSDRLLSGYSELVRTFDPV